MTTTRRPGTIRPIERPTPYRAPSADALAVAPQELREAFETVDRLEAERAEVAAEVTRCRGDLDRAYDRAVLTRSELYLSGLAHQAAEASANVLAAPREALEAAAMARSAIDVAYARARSDLLGALAAHGAAWAASAKARSDQALGRAVDLLAEFEGTITEAMLGISVANFIGSARRGGKAVYVPKPLSTSTTDGQGVVVEVLRATDLIGNLHRLLDAASAALAPQPEEADEAEEIEARAPRPGQMVSTRYGAVLVPQATPEADGIEDDDGIEVEE